MTSSSQILQTFLPKPITDVVISYLEDLSSAESIRKHFHPNKTEAHQELAEKLLNQFHLTVTKDSDQETKEQKKRTRVKAEGVANALGSLDATQLKCLFLEWQNMAGADEEENGSADFCSRYRLLIAYYLSTTQLRTATYGMDKVENYLQKLSDEKQVPADDKLIHALYVKFAVAHNDVEKVHKLLKISSACLNLLDADLSDRNYNFTAVDFSYACLKNVKLGCGFFLNNELIVSSLNKANLENSIYEELPYHLVKLDNVNKLSHAAAGLDIRYTEVRITALHIYAMYGGVTGNELLSDDCIYGSEQILNLLHQGANPRIADWDGNSAYDYKIYFYGMALANNAVKSVTHKRFQEQVNVYNLLIASLSAEELNQQKSAIYQMTNKQLLHLSLCILSFIILSTFSLTNFFIFFFPAAPTAVSFISFMNYILLMSSGVSAIAIGTVAIYLLINTIRGIIPLTKTIDQHQLASNNADYKTHLLLKRILVLPDNTPEKWLTLDDQLLFDSLSKEDLEKQKQINNQIKNDGYWGGLRYILIGLALAAAAVAGWFGLLTLIPYMSLGTIGAASTLNIIAISTLLTASFTGIATSAIVGLELIYTAFTSLFTTYSTKNAIEQLIDHELLTRKFDKAEPTTAPQLVSAKKVEIHRRASASPSSVVDVSVFNRTSPKESKDDIDVALLHTLNVI